jgi:hypothetical protein
MSDTKMETEVNTDIEAEQEDMLDPITLEEANLMVGAAYDSLVLVFNLEKIRAEGVTLTEDEETAITNNKAHCAAVASEVEGIVEDTKLLKMLKGENKFNPKYSGWEVVRKTNDSLQSKEVVERTPTKEELLAREKEYVKQLFKTSFELAVDKLADVIADGLLSPKVLTEYSAKERLTRRAVESGDYTVFEDVSTALGLTAEDYTKLVLGKSEEWSIAYDTALVKLGNDRMTIASLIDADELTKAKELLQRMANPSNYVG